MVVHGNKSVHKQTAKKRDARKSRNSKFQSRRCRESSVYAKKKLLWVEKGMSNPGAGNIPIVKLEDLVVGTSYRLLDTSLGFYYELINKDEVQKVVKNLHERPHELISKTPMDNGWFKLEFKMVAGDVAVAPKFLNGDRYVVTGEMFAKHHEVEFAQEALRGGRRKTRSQKRKSRKSRKSRRRV